MCIPASQSIFNPLFEPANQPAALPDWPQTYQTGEMLGSLSLLPAHRCGERRNCVLVSSKTCFAVQHVTSCLLYIPPTISNDKPRKKSQRRHSEGPVQHPFSELVQTYLPHRANAFRIEQHSAVSFVFGGGNMANTLFRCIASVLLGGDAYDPIRNLKAITVSE
jgi:hypothetical protein